MENKDELCLEVEKFMGESTYVYCFKDLSPDNILIYSNVDGFTDDICFQVSRTNVKSIIDKCTIGMGVKKFLSILPDFTVSNMNVIVANMEKHKND